MYRAARVYVPRFCRPKVELLLLRPWFGTALKLNKYAGRTINRGTYTRAAGYKVCLLGGIYSISECPLQRILL